MQPHESPFSGREVAIPGEPLPPESEPSQSPYTLQKIDSKLSVHAVSSPISSSTRSSSQLPLCSTSANSSIPVATTIACEAQDSKSESSKPLSHICSDSSLNSLTEKHQETPEKSENIDKAKNIDLEEIYTFMVSPLDDSVPLFSLSQSSPSVATESVLAVSGAPPQRKGVVYKKKYKQSHNKVRPVATTLPDEFRIVRHKNEKALDHCRPLPRIAPDFIPTPKFTQERMDALKLDPHHFLYPAELRLVQWVLAENERALAWDESEKGRFKDSYFDPVVIPTIEHIPWQQRNIPIPPGILDDVVKIIKDKIQSGVYEPSSSSYRSRIFCVIKKDGKSLRIVHDLQELNRVTIRDTGVPPPIYEIVDEMAGRACYTTLDLFVGYDHRVLDPRSRDLTTFQTPLGAFRVTTLPMGYANAVAIFQGDVSHIVMPRFGSRTVPNRV